MPPGRAAAPSPASSAPRLGARPAAPSPPASDASRPTLLHPDLPFPARALPQGPGMLRFTPDSAVTELPAGVLVAEPLPHLPVQVVVLVARVFRVDEALEASDDLADYARALAALRQLLRL